MISSVHDAEVQPVKESAVPEKEDSKQAVSEEKIANPASEESVSSKEDKNISLEEKKSEPVPESKTDETMEVKMNEENNVVVTEEVPAPAPKKSGSKKSVIANPDRQLVNMVQRRSFNGPNDKLPTYLL